MVLSDCDDHESLLFPQLYNHIGTGYRQRFSVISKADVITWALENVKAYDVCKEIKSVIDSTQSDPDIPDNLMGRLLKLRFLVLKQEGLESRNSAKQIKEQTEQVPSMTESIEVPKNGKLGKKDEKEKDRPKQASPKKSSKGNSKVVDAPSRPESAQATIEPSKRKLKLRDRKNKADSKPASIDDEPEDGPDVYYALRDFNVPGVINCLMEENDIPVHAIAVIPCSEISCLDRAGPLKKGRDFRLTKYFSFCIQNTREFALLASDESLWKQVAWCEIEKESSMDFKELFDAIARKLYEILKEETLFSSFYSIENVIQIPTYEEAGIGKHELKLYESILSENTYAPIEALLGLAVELVIRLIPDDEYEVSGAENMPILDDTGFMTLYMNNRLERMWFTDLSKERAKDCARRLLKYGDEYSQALYGMERLSAYGVNLIDMLQSMFEIQPLAPAKVQRCERLIPAPEISYYEAAGIPQVLGKEVLERALLQREFEDILSCDVDQWNLDSWCWVESFDKHTLQQVMNGAKSLLPLALIRTTTLPGRRLLIAYHGYGRVSDQSAKISSNVRIKTRVNFGLFHDLDENYRSFVQPSSHETPSAYMAGDQIVQHSDDVSVFYTSWGSNLHVHNISSMYAGTDFYTVLTCHDQSIIWGNEELSKDGAFLTASFENGTVLHVNRKHDSISVNVSLPSGLFVELRRDGTVAQRILKQKDLETATSTSRIAEMNRVILSDGTVLRFFSGDTAEVLYPTGSTSTKTSSGWTSANIEGHRLITTSTGEVQATTPIRAIKESHIALGKVIQSREDSVSLTLTKDGMAIAEHCDRTRILSTFPADRFDFQSNEWSKGEQKSVVVWSEGMATVSIDALKNVGVTLPNGATLKRNLEKDGPVKVFGFRFEQASEGDNDCVLSFSSTGKANLLPNRSSPEVYDLNWVTGEFSLVDSSGVEIEVKADGKAETRQAQDLKAIRKPKDTPRVPPKKLVEYLRTSSDIRSPSPLNPPRLFVVEEDGSGFEMLRDEDVWRYLKRNPRLQVSEEILTDKPDAVQLSIIKQLEKRPGVLGESQMAILRQVRKKL
ncbi:Sperm-associated antigen 17 [Dinochytrium kinnereticum]|nr:Sperm-associated antigen 17 [Dinochytrium kinnereticum]